MASTVRAGKTTILTPPDLEYGALTSRLQRSYGVAVVRVAFLPLGADPDTAVYRVVTEDGENCFLKLRRGSFNDSSVTLLKTLRRFGVGHVLPPLPTLGGQLWTRLASYTLVLYPFVTGENGYVKVLSERNWRSLGATLKRLHSLKLPSALRQGISHETFDPSGRAAVRALLAQLEHTSFSDAASVETAAFLGSKRAAILEMVGQAEQLAEVLKSRDLEVVLCHADLHAGNLLISEDTFYIVDWDAPLFAPKERDLMFIGGAQGFAGRSPAEEEQLFYEGYGEVDIDPVALAYYRFERIVQDIAVYGSDLLSQRGDEAERRQALRYLRSNFVPGGTLARAYAVGAVPNAFAR